MQISVIKVQSRWSNHCILANTRKIRLARDFEGCLNSVGPILSNFLTPLTAPNLPHPAVVCRVVAAPENNFVPPDTQSLVANLPR
jgi:hypothetical protein